MSNKVHFFYGIIIGILLCACFGFKIKPGATFNWTDSKGNAIAGSYEGMDGNNVLINYEGKILPIPLSKLSSQSQNLALMLSARYIYQWATYEGRKFEAEFLDYDTDWVYLRNYPGGNKWKIKLVHLHPTSQKVVTSLRKNGHSNETEQFLVKVIKHQPEEAVQPVVVEPPSLEQRVLNIEERIEEIVSRLNSHKNNTSRHHSHNGMTTTFGDL
jgi:tetrahydromethanopterin S-methyltransferase subunit G